MSHNKGMRLPPEPLTMAEARSLLKACSKRSASGLRAAALIILLWRAQLRCSEALALLPHDLDEAAGTIRVRHGKGDRCDVVGLDPLGWAVIGRWMDRRRALGLGASNPVICTLAGGHQHTQYARRLLPMLGRRAGISKRVHAHGLRHTGALELATEGVPMHMIRDQLRHANIATTDRYLRQIAPTARIEAMKRRTWEE